MTYERERKRAKERERERQRERDREKERETRCPKAICGHRYPCPAVCLKLL